MKYAEGPCLVDENLQRRFHDGPDAPESTPRPQNPAATRAVGSRASHPHISELTVGALRALRSPDRRMAFDRAVAARSCNPMY